MFMHITCKLGNMKKAVEWVIYPIDSANPNQRIIQCDKRICKLDLNTQKGVLSKAQNYPGYHALSKLMGSTDIDIPDDVIKQLKADVTPVDKVNLSDLIVS